MSEKYIELRQAIFRDLRDRGRPIAVSIGDVLEWLDEHPDQVPGRTIMRSEFDSAVDAVEESQYATTVARSLEFAQALGFTVVPDPEPTNAEKLASHVLRITDDLYIGLSQDDIDKIAKWLDAQGVKVTGGES